MRPRSVGHLLDRPPRDLGERLRARQQALDVLAREVVDRQQVLHAATSSSCADGHLVDAVDLLDADVHALVARGRQVLADVVGPDRQLAVAAVGQHRQLHPLRAPVVEERVDRGAHGASRVEDVVDQDHRHAVDREVDLRGVDDRLARGVAHADVVAVEADVELAERDLLPDELRDLRRAAGAPAPHRACGSRRSRCPAPPSARRSGGRCARACARCRGRRGRPLLFALLPGLSGPRLKGPRRQ